MSTRRDSRLTFARWRSTYRTEAVADGCNELRRHLEYLDIDSAPQDLLAGTEMLLAAAVAYQTLDGRASGDFLRQQKYRLTGSELPCYCLTFLLGFGAVGRILTDDEFTGLDFADLYGHPWQQFRTVGYQQVWISRLDGQVIDSAEMESMDRLIRSDLYFDYTEDEVYMDLSLTDLDDSACLSVQDRMD